MNSAAHRLFQWLLFAYPAEFRCEYGAEMGRVIADRFRDERGVRRCWLWMQTIADVLGTAIQERYRIMLRDLKHSWRRLAAHPATAVTAILSLALGIGANTTVFSVLYAAVLKPLGYPDLDRRVILYTTNLNSPNRANRSLAAPLDFMDWRAQSKTLEDFHLFTYRGSATATGGPLPERVTNQLVTPGLLDSLGVRPVIGRLPREDDDRPVVIGEAYWHRAFGGRQDVLGKKLVVDGSADTIVGVVPAGFELFDEPSGIDLWWAIELRNPEWHSRQVPWLMATAKLRSGVTLEQAQAEMSQIASQLASAHPATNRHRGALLVPLLEARNGWIGGLLYPLFGAVTFVLLIACTNVANLLLARAAARRRELSLRAALGAARTRLVRELLADGIVLAIPGVAVGLALAYAGLALYRAMVPPMVRGISNVDLNTPALVFTSIAGLVAGIVAAVLPAIEGSRADLHDALKEGSRGSVGKVRQRVRSALVAVQIALALVLLTGAGLMINTIARLQAQSLGFDPENVLVAQLHISGNRYMTDAPPRGIDMRYVEPPTAQLIDHVLREVRAIPGVESAAIGATIPTGPSSSTGARITIAGRAGSQEDQRRSVYNVVSSGYFETLRIPLKRGRYLHDRDVASAPWTAVVNEKFAREFFPGEDALGRTITVVASPDEQPRQIVGVVADVIQYMPRVPVQPEIFTSYLQQTREIPGNFQGGRFRPKLILRSPVLHTIKAEMLSEIVGRFDRELVVFGVNTLEHFAAERGSLDWFYASSLGFFSGIALLLSAVGIYGLMNYSVTDRLQEIGIRVSLGASRGRVVWLIAAHGLKVAVAGLAAGVVAAFATTRLIERMLFGIKPWDPLTFSVVALFLLAVAMTACLFPAFRATRIDPVKALRAE
jgi:putative ABC transport system permease protein